MKKSTRYARASALPAIAAAMALSSTPVFAQQAQPVQTEPAPVTTDQAAPAPDPVPAVSDTIPTAGSPIDSSATSTSSVVDKPAKTTASVSKPKSVMHARAAALPATRQGHATARSTIARMSTARAPVASNAVAPAAPAPAAPVPIASSQSTPASGPAVDVQTKQTATAKQSVRSHKHDNTVPIAAGGVLALLAIGGAAVAANRRRDEDEEEWLDDEDNSHVHVASDSEDSRDTRVQSDQPAILAPPISAYDWRATEQSPVAMPRETLTESDDRGPGETWIERAYRGPSPLNPSVSLKTRLKRAAFFDKRERDAAAGLAEPIEPTAGLPERMVDERQEERQSEFA
ncbi:MAG TPA: hypothetical protein VGU01_09840 [Sphingomicrobium sp.]|nr:hypothetical protein [Sphingomicrobium sp.]